jgi:sialidase-1
MQSATGPTGESHCAARSISIAALILLPACLASAVAASERANADRENRMTPKLLFPRQRRRFFRIPSIAVTRAGTLLAFAGEKKGSIGDFGRETDVVLRRSTDGGATWTDAEAILSKKGVDFHSGPVVVDRQTGAIFKFARSHGARTRPRTDWRENYVLRSDDDGKTWKARVLPLTHPRAVRRFGPGNGGHGIQLADGTLVIQGGYRRRAGGELTTSLCLIESRDHGKTWRIMKGSDLDNTHAEFCIAETGKGRIYVNVREVRGDERHVGVLNTADPSQFKLRRTVGLPGARCHAGITLVRGKAAAHLYYTGPTGETDKERYDASTRVNLTLFRSDLDGRKWERVALIHNGKAAYSDLAVLPDGDLVCLYESGRRFPHEQIFFVRIPKEVYAPGRR